MVEQLSIWSLVANASAVVQVVMVILALASFMSWVMIFQRFSFIRKTSKELRDFEDRFWSGIDLGQLYREITDASDTLSGAETIFCAGIKEYTRMTQQKHYDPDAVMDGVQRSMRVALAREEEKLDHHLPFLATVGSTSPYIGLFGTVWGIMNSFRGLANVHQATLASVAPGISEALVATAIGLFAAIPAVIAYNRFSAKSEWLMNNYDTFADEFSSILHRRIHSPG
ncbi:protein TolQ [Neptunomonas antarctica]|uniref:Tol-Pal system protein TolQ n=1 Tax=Neptunomonas antarctica TaxID=619304 RepID=A0A1N7KBN6_9GAMM|nr:protein TolQ [Neptunomonas antarctica]SIS58844.1 Cell division and transport-associated protein TolQ [Neptunomonas antarctica]